MLVAKDSRVIRETLEPKVPSETKVTLVLKARKVTLEPKVLAASRAVLDLKVRKVTLEPKVLLE